MEIHTSLCQTDGNLLCQMQNLFALEYKEFPSSLTIDPMLWGTYHEKTETPTYESFL
jgi:hypothetical protein